MGDDYWIDVRAENSAGESSYTSDLATSTLAALTVPSFTDDTGTAQSWTVGTSIAAVQVPAASGNPTPAYAVVGGLPSGLAFATGTRRITGTPTAAGSGTIRAATNSQGWTGSVHDRRGFGSAGIAIDPDLIQSNDELPDAGNHRWQWRSTLVSVALFNERNCLQH